MSTPKPQSVGFPLVKWFWGIPILGNLHRGSFMPWGIWSLSSLGCWRCWEKAKCICHRHCSILPSGKHTKNYWKWIFIVDLPINSVIFHSYVSLPEGRRESLPQNMNLTPKFWGRLISPWKSLKYVCQALCIWRGNLHVYVNCMCTHSLAPLLILFYSNKKHANIKFHQALPIWANLDSSPTWFLHELVGWSPFLASVWIGHDRFDGLRDLNYLDKS